MPAPPKRKIPSKATSFRKRLPMLKRTHRVPSQPALAARILARRRRGVVLLLVLCALAVAGIIAYTVLATASLEAQSSAYARTALRAESMAESGVNLAMHYLLQPEDSPVALTTGAFGDKHYPGQSNIAMGDDSFSVSVVNVAAATYRIESTGKSRDSDGNICERKLQVRVVGVGEWKARGALHYANALQLAANVTVTGNVVTASTFNLGGVVTGLKLASNYLSHSGDPSWEPSPSPPEVAVPPFATLSLVRAVAENEGWYVYNNTRCQVDYIFSSTLSSPPVASASNAGGVFVYLGSAPLTLGGAAAAQFNGTLIVKQANLVLSQSWTFSPKAKMPALLVSGTTSFSSGTGKLKVNGVYYCGNSFASSSSSTVNPVVVNGATLCATTSGSSFGSGVTGGISLVFDAAKADVPDLTRQGIRYSRLQIEDWEQAN